MPSSSRPYARPSLGRLPVLAFASALMLPLASRALVADTLDDRSDAAQEQEERQSPDASKLESGEAGRLAPGTAVAGAAAAGVSGKWVRAVDAALAAQEYRLSPRNDPSNGGDPAADGWTAPNRLQRLRTEWVGGHVYIAPRQVPAGQAGWKLTWSFQNVGRFPADSTTVCAPLGVTTEEVGNAFLAWQRGDGITEWYVNDPAGIEQGFDIQEPPTGDLDGPVGEPLRIRARVAGLVPRLAEDGSQIFLADPAQLDRAAGDGKKHVDVLSIRGLVAIDAAGMLLPASFDVQGTLVDFVVDDTDAVYPISVDPLFTLPVGMIRSGQLNANLGVSVASAGDVNGDGYTDVIVGAYLYDNGQADEGAAFVYFGSQTGPGTQPQWRAEGDQAAAWFGISVASAGDVNRDSAADVIIGASKYDNGQSDEGAAFVYLGSGAGLGPNGTPLNADWRAESNQINAYFGWSVASVGDHDGDSYADVVVGAYNYGVSFGGTLVPSGGVFVWNGGVPSGGNPSGLGPFGTPANARWFDLADQKAEQLGWAVASAGDLNNDHFSDLIVGSPNFDVGSASNQGAAYVYPGPLPAGTSGPSWTARGALANDFLGYSVASAGDVNDDGFDDIIVGVPYATGRRTPVVREGIALVWLGAPASIFNRTGLGPDGTQANARWSAESDQGNSRFGWAVSGVPDITNCTRRSGVLVGAPLYDFGGKADRGLAAMWDSRAGTFGLGFGPALNGILGTNLVGGNQSWHALGDDANDNFGYSVAGTADTNKDGISDAVVGAVYGEAQAPVDEGQAYLFAGIDLDVDADGILDACDSCIDFDRDGFGDAGYPWNTCPLDNCANVPNPSQANADGDAFGDACDACTDTDGDGFGNPGFPANTCQLDNCPNLNTTFAGNQDPDGDGLGNLCDNCDFNSNPLQENCDLDPDGNACDTDDDNDGRLDGLDPDDCNFRICGDSEANPGWPGPPPNTGDGCDDCAFGGGFNPANDGANCAGEIIPDQLCDFGDPDDDNDGILDVPDPVECDPTRCADADGDGCDDCRNVRPGDPANDGTPAGAPPTSPGDCDGDGLCNSGDIDADNDGAPNDADAFDCDPRQCYDQDGDGCDDCSRNPTSTATPNSPTRWPNYTPSSTNDGTPNPPTDPTGDCDLDGICSLTDPDDDNDGVPDTSELAAERCDDTMCGDFDGDGCDDCTAGFGFDPHFDGNDCDGDYLCDVGDPDDDGDGVNDEADGVLGPDTDGDGDMDGAFRCDSSRCGNSDGDTCDDCSTGAYNPAGDGVDCDKDRMCDLSDPDIDNDGAPNGADTNNCNIYVCSDTELNPGWPGPPANTGDGCNDCQSGTFDQANDGFDCDGDTLCDVGDPDNDNDGMPDSVTDPPCNGACADADGDGCDDCTNVPGPPGDPMNDQTPAGTAGDCDMDGLCSNGLDNDDDNDGIPDVSDPDDTCGAPACGDVDGDTCDDCVNGPSDPFNDGPDCDGDGLCDAFAGETDDDNDTVPDTSDSVDCNKFRCEDRDAAVLMTPTNDGCDDCSIAGQPQPSNDGTDTDADGMCDACTDTTPMDGICDIGGTADTDDDNDGRLDTQDSFPTDRFRCADTDNPGALEDGCDDCSSGTFAPGNDGPDCDGDGICNAPTMIPVPAGINVDNDDDNDGRNDGPGAGLDSQNCNPQVCGDSDNDTCDDCSQNPTSASSPRPWGTYTPTTTADGGMGGDTDGDTLCDNGDPDDDNDGAPDNNDTNRLNPKFCHDSDLDNCDECSGNPTTTATPNSPMWPTYAPSTASDGTDTDGDTLCNMGDPDDDNDGVNDGPDTADLDPRDCQDLDNDGCNDCSANPTMTGTSNAFPGWPQYTPTTTNETGTDTDGDTLCDGVLNGQGDPDDDNDGVADASDSFPLDPRQCRDIEFGGTGDGCNDCSQNPKMVGAPKPWPTYTPNPNSDGADCDGDQRCDATDPDDDNDGSPDTPEDSDDCNPFLCVDSDSDTCNDCFNGTKNPNNDGPDSDGDGRCNASDNCDFVFNPTQANPDGDACGTGCDTDPAVFSATCCSPAVPSPC